MFKEPVQNVFEILPAATFEISEKHKRGWPDALRALRAFRTSFILTARTVTFTQRAESTKKPGTGVFDSVLLRGNYLGVGTWPIE
jgi:hypothetical protein